MQILLVEDDRSLSEAMRAILEKKGYLIDAVFDGKSAVDYAEILAYDAIVLDVMLPEMDGFDVARTLRKKGISTPILMLTARTAVADKVNGLNGGADDYMTKPFDTEEFLARVNALTRRKGEVILDELSFEDLTLDLESAVLSGPSGTVQLSRKEMDVLRLFLSHPTATLPKETILVKVWGMESEATENNVEAYISFLRKKMHFVHSRVAIRTVQKIGYRLEAGV